MAIIQHSTEGVLLADSLYVLKRWVTGHEEAKDALGPAPNKPRAQGQVVEETPFHKLSWT